MGGRQKIQTQWVKVLDRRLFQRLQDEVCEGDEIVATVVTEWHERGYTTYLADFIVPVPDVSATQSGSTTRPTVRVGELP
jgi:hypothetical protein